MSTSSRRKNVPRIGTLRIGNQWNAINIIARSQTHPLKAVCELAENAIDARARQIHIIRRRSHGRVYLEVIDDGQGVAANEQGEPDFARIATHVCDSMKRHLKEEERAGIHGEFGIGLLSFWSLGEELRMISAGRDGRLCEMILKRGQRSYTVRPMRGVLSSGGTRVIVGPLLEATRNVVTGEKLARYLSAELRDRIRNTGAQIHVLDRIARKDLAVRPREFEGQRIDLPSRIATARGEIVVELYLRPDCVGQRESGVAVCKDGTRVLRDLTELVQFQQPPWTDGRLEGVLDFPALNLAPGTRHGIVPDEQLDAFVAGIHGIQPQVVAAIERMEQAESDKASRDILRQVHRAFVSALRELPANEYLFFDLPEPKHPLGRHRTNGAAEQSEPGLPLEPQEEHGVASASDQDEEAAHPAPLLPSEPGPLAAVRITPRQGRRRVGDECLLRAIATDAHGTRIHHDIHFTWQIVEGNGGILVLEPHQCRVTSSVAGQLAVEVRATQADVSVSDQAFVKFLENLPQAETDSSKGLPSYRLEPEHGKPWRSRYDSPKNEIVINSAHRDFLSSKATAAKHRRYIGKLYAKEVVLINFPHEASNQAMERLIELTLRTEDAL